MESSYIRGSLFLAGGIIMLAYVLGFLQSFMNIVLGSLALLAIVYGLHALGVLETLTKLVRKNHQE